VHPGARKSYGGCVERICGCTTPAQFTTRVSAAAPYLWPKGQRAAHLAAAQKSVRREQPELRHRSHIGQVFLERLLAPPVACSSGQGLDQRSQVTTQTRESELLLSLFLFPCLWSWVLVLRLAAAQKPAVDRREQRAARATPSQPFQPGLFVVLST
jgi:hypothetical protein